MAKSIDESAIGRLYFIESVDQNAIKIGFAGNIASRLASLQTGNPGTLLLQEWIPCHIDAEREIHRLLKPFRISREWYHGAVSDLVADELQSILFGRSLERREAGMPEDPSDYISVADVQSIAADITAAIEGDTGLGGEVIFGPRPN